jgi:hypothetical protein
VFSHDTLPGAPGLRGDTASQALAVVDAAQDRELERPTTRFAAQTRRALPASPRARLVSLIGAAVVLGSALAYLLFAPSAEPPRAAAAARPEQARRPQTASVSSVSSPPAATRGTIAASSAALAPSEPAPQAASAATPASVKAGEARSPRVVRREDAPVRSVRRVRKEPKRSTIPTTRSDVMPNPYHSL